MVCLCLSVAKLLNFFTTAKEYLHIFCCLEITALSIFTIHIIVELFIVYKSGNSFCQNVTWHSPLLRHGKRSILCVGLEAKADSSNCAFACAASCSQACTPFRFLSFLIVNGLYNYNVRFVRDDIVLVNYCAIRECCSPHLAYSVSSVFMPEKCGLWLNLDYTIC